jgi:4-amino-4-deoxy-L-arabinose transferase-like glycosyltransferase
MINSSFESSGRRSAADGWPLILAAFLLLVAWSFAVPVFESPDEMHHWQYARYLHDAHRLPLYGPAFVEANSPPLYYALVAPVATESASPPPALWYDVNGSLVMPFAPRFFQNAGGDFLRYRPIRLARFISVLMSVLTVWLCWRAGQRLGGNSLAILCASLVAFLPQFTFRGTAVSNDVLVTMMAAATLLCIVRLLQEPFTWRLGSAAAVALSAAYLAKISAICLIGPVTLAIWWTEGSAPQRLFRIVGVLGLAGLIVAPWSLRNVVLYGDPFASGAMPGAVGQIMSYRSLTSPYFRTTFPSLMWRSFVGLFGWMNLMLPEVYYRIFWVLGLLGLGSVAFQVATRRRDARIVTILAAIVVLNLAVVIHINRSFEQPQGRYMFVALPALALLVAMGLDARPRSPSGVKAAATLAIGLAVLNGVILIRYLIPAYYPPVTATLSNTRIALSSPSLHDLVPQADGSAIVRGNDPQFGFRTRLNASEVAFLAFEIGGTSNDVNVNGSVYFAVDDKPGTETQQIGFIWHADGRQQLIRIPLLANADWKGTVTSVRIDPVNAALDRHQGDFVRIENPRAGGNLSRIVP